MSYDKRTPPIKLELTRELFNKLISILNYYIKQENDLSYNSQILKDKLYNYSVLRSDDTNDYMEVRFFPREAGNMIYLLLSCGELLTEKNDYVQEILNIRR